MYTGQNFDVPDTAKNLVAGASNYTLTGGSATRGAAGNAIDPARWWAQMFAGQEQFLQQVLGGFTQMETGFGAMFTGLLDTGNETFDKLAGNLAQLGSNLLGSLAKPGGALSGLFEPVSSALGFLGPVGSILSTGFSLFKGIKSLFGRKHQNLSAPIVNYSDYHPAMSSSSPVTQSSRTVNVYINGQSLNSAVAVDRTLNRAGVDRSLRDQIKELVRSGANPVA